MFSSKASIISAYLSMWKSLFDTVPENSFCLRGHQQIILSSSPPSAISVLPALGQAWGSRVSCDPLLTRRLHWSYMATAPESSSPALLPLPPPVPLIPWLTWRLPDLRPSNRPPPPPTGVQDSQHWHQQPLLATRHVVDSLPLWPHNICMIINLGLTRRKAKKKKWPHGASQRVPGSGSSRVTVSSSFCLTTSPRLSAGPDSKRMFSSLLLRSLLSPSVSLSLPFLHHLRHLALPYLPGIFSLLLLWFSELWPLEHWKKKKPGRYACAGTLSGYGRTIAHSVLIAGGVPGTKVLKLHFSVTC